MKQSMAIISLLCIGCTQTESKSDIVPSAGTYTMTPIELDNQCGPAYDIEDFDSLPPSIVDIDVHLEAKQLSITFDNEYNEMYILELEDNVATYDLIINQYWSADQTFVITQEQVMYFKWSSPSISYGYVGVNVRCDGECPSSAPEFGVENVPCTSNLVSSLEMGESQ